MTTATEAVWIRKSDFKACSNGNTINLYGNYGEGGVALL